MTLELSKHNIEL